MSEVAETTADQAIGFMLEFINSASPGLKEATNDFDTARQALERAVESARSSFNTMEEITSDFAKSVVESANVVQHSSDAIRMSLMSLSDIQVLPPNFDPINEALQKFKDEIVVPKDMGISSGLEDLVEVRPSGPDLDPIIESLNKLGEVESEQADPIADAMKDLENLEHAAIDDADIVAAFEDSVAMLDKATDTESILKVMEDSEALFNKLADSVVVFQDAAPEDDIANFLQALDEHGLKEESSALPESLEGLQEDFSETYVKGFQAALDNASGFVWAKARKEFKDLGAAGEKLAEDLASEVGGSYEKLIDLSKSFASENADAFAEAKDLGKVWDTFWDTDDASVKNFKKLLESADAIDLQPVIEQLKIEMGSDALTDTFWRSIAANETVNKEFFGKLKDMFSKEKGTPKAWWDMYTRSAKKLFWPVFQKQGEEKAKGMAAFLMGKMKAAFNSPIGQITAAIQLSNIIDQLFGPAIEDIVRLFGTLLTPFIQQFMFFVNQLEPAFIQLSQVSLAFTAALQPILLDLVANLLPVMADWARNLTTLTPLLVDTAKAAVSLGKDVMRILIPALKVTAEFLELAAFAVIGFALATYDALEPVFNFVGELVEAIGVSELLGYVIGGFLTLVFTTFIYQTLVSAALYVWGYAAAMTAAVSTSWGLVTATYGMVSGFIISMIPTVTAAIAVMYGWATALAAGTGGLSLIIPAIAALGIGVAYLTGAFDYLGAAILYTVFPLSILFDLTMWGAKKFGWIDSTVSSFGLLKMAVGFVYTIFEKWWGMMKSTFIPTMQSVWGLIVRLGKSFGWLLPTTDQFSMCEAVVEMFYIGLSQVFSIVGLLVGQVGNLLGVVGGVASAFWGWTTALVAFIDPLRMVSDLVSVASTAFGWLFGTVALGQMSWGLDWVMDSVTAMTSSLFSWFDATPGWVKWLFGLNADKESVSEAPSWFQSWRGNPAKEDEPLNVLTDALAPVTSPPAMTPVGTAAKPLAANAQPAEVSTPRIDTSVSQPVVSEFNVETEVVLEKTSNSIVRAIEASADKIVEAVNESQSAKDLDLCDLKALANFGIA